MKASTQIIAFGIFPMLDVLLYMFRTAVAAQEIALQGNKGTYHLLTINWSGVTCVPE